jgi:cupin fold WbuC family metalloprotein
VLNSRLSHKIVTRIKHKQGSVYIPCDDPTIIDSSTLNELRGHAMTAPQGNARILLHRDAATRLHEMLIVHKKGCYVRPHINKGSPKSYIMLEGEMVVAWFKEDGVLTQICHLSGAGFEVNRILRFEDEVFHTLLPLTSTVTFVETILGPHTNTIYAPWAPSLDEPGFQSFNIEMNRRILENLKVNDL